MEIKKTTLELQTKILQLKERYLTSQKPEDKKDHAFFSFVKEETTPTYLLNQQWEEQAMRFVQNKKVHVHPQQIVSTSENIALLLMHSYYIDVRKKRYMELHHSVLYVFNRLLEDVDRIQANTVNK
ncbi:YppE family protein [Aquibacillus sp. 3ASR75-11]|uniref:YppE family protein n=1 Tax=Terrihalobacillus insolitus TaxID=2950438 RepID=A0A9X3WSQ2_9BACI|nr:DUF1798 family protein [Terrihalobacillus insolitus]MDC3413013.1 YppE family protein [Terrihalobacillus insolitus]MDC3424755.1 YppE family protein [Terrihalobacillus insolitus]